MLKSVPAAKLIRHVSGEMAFSLPYSSTALFASFFDELNGRQPQLGIASYGLSMSTLEEVFLRLQHTVCWSMSTTSAAHSPQHDSEHDVNEGSAANDDILADDWQLTAHPEPAASSVKVERMAVIFYKLSVCRSRRS